MGEVIYVNFKQEAAVLELDQFIFEFVEALHGSCLVDDDIEDIVEAVEDKDRYDELDPDLKDIVDQYFNVLHNL